MVGTPTYPWSDTMPTSTPLDLSRRAFLTAGAAVAAGVALGVHAPKAAAATRPHLKKSVKFGMVSDKGPDARSCPWKSACRLQRTPVRECRAGYDI